MQKTGEKYHDFCIDDAMWHLMKAHEALTASETDPETYYKESVQSAKTIIKSLPVLIVNSLSRDEDDDEVTIVEPK
jgi:hypothetical protein